MKKVLYLSLLLLLFLLGVVLTYKKAAEAGCGMKVIIDRFEGDFAVVELPNKTMVDMDIKLLEPDVKEGDIIEIRTLQHETENRKKNTEDLMKELFE